MIAGCPVPTKENMTNNAKKPEVAYGSVVTFSCSEGFEFSSSLTAYLRASCSTSGKFVPQISICVIKGTKQKEISIVTFERDPASDKL